MSIVETFYRRGCKKNSPLRVRSCGKNRDWILNTARKESCPLKYTVNVRYNVYKLDLVNLMKVKRKSATTEGYRKELKKKEKRKERKYIHLVKIKLFTLLETFQNFSKMIRSRSASSRDHPRG